MGSVVTCAHCGIEQTVKKVKVYDGGPGFELSCGHRNGYCLKCDLLLEDTGQQPDTIVPVCPSCSFDNEPQPAKNQDTARDSNRHGDWILYAISAGFVLLIAALWIVERTKFFGSNEPETLEVSVNTALILVIAIPMLVVVRQLLTRLHNLEKFIIVCS